MIGSSDFFSGLDFPHRVHEKFLTFGVPGVLGGGETGMVDAGDVFEDAADGGVGAEGVRVGADDVGEGGTLAGVIVVEREIGALRFFWQAPEELRELFFDGGGGGEGFGSEERLFGEEEGSWWDDLCCENALAFSGDGLDFPEWS